jgi:hypothetical protein
MGRQTGAATGIVRAQANVSTLEIDDSEEEETGARVGQSALPRNLLCIIV